MVNILELLTVNVPVFVKLGFVPDCVNVRLPVFEVIVPELTCAADAKSICNALSMVIIP